MKFLLFCLSAVFVGEEIWLGVVGFSLETKVISESVKRRKQCRKSPSWFDIWLVCLEATTH